MGGKGERRRKRDRERKRRTERERERHDTHQEQGCMRLIGIKSSRRWSRHMSPTPVDIPVQMHPTVEHVVGEFKRHPVPKSREAPVAPPAPWGPPHMTQRYPPAGPAAGPGPQPYPPAGMAPPGPPGGAAYPPAYPSAYSYPGPGQGNPFDGIQPFTLLFCK
jgi:hypothetical protein